MTEFTTIGKNKTKPDALSKVTGSCIYTEDTVLPGMLEGRILRSTRPHAEIVRIDTTKARALPGVFAVLTHDDCPKDKWTRSSMAEALPAAAFEGEAVLDQYILSEKSRYIGDWIGAVAATDVYTAEKALELIEVEYKDLPFVVNPYEARKPGAPVIHEDKTQNIAQAMDHEFNCGDVEKAFSESDYVVEFAGKSSRQKHCQLEPDVAIADWQKGGRLTMISTTQGPHLCKKAFARRVFLELKEGDIRWITPYLGGGFGGRLAFNVEPVAALLSKVTSKPVRVTTTREEDFAGWGARTEQYQTMKLGATKDGALTGIEMHIMSDSGAYYSHSGTTALVNMQHTLGLFRCPNIHGDMEIIYTNTPTSSGFRGYGNAEGAFILQQGMDMLAEKAGMDPVEFRLRNVKEVGEPSFFIPKALEHCALKECIEEGAKEIGWEEKWKGWGDKKTGRLRRGVGMSVMNHASGAGGFLLEHSNAILKMNEDGSANLTVAPSDMGQGINGALCQIAAEALGVSFEEIHIVYGDTDTSLFDIGSHACRSITVIGNAVIDAANKMKKRLYECAIKKFEAQGITVKEDDLNVLNGAVVIKSDTDNKISVAEISHDEIYNYSAEGGHLVVTGSYLPQAHSPNFQAAFCEVEVDVDTGVLKVVRYVAAHDIGKAINPQSVEGQLEGGVVQGLGFALTEDFVVDEKTGRVLSDSFATYKLPGCSEIPEIKSILIEDPTPFGPFGAKGVGEPGLVNVAPAIANALYDAVGIRINTLPITPEKILSALNTLAR